MEITSENINDIYNEAIRDPRLLSQLDVNEILNVIDNDNNSYLDNKSLENINNEIFEIINNLNVDIESKQLFCSKLINYRFVDELHELHKGKHVRWIRHNTKTINLTNGGIVVNIKFLDNGTQILVKNSGNKFIQIKFDECFIFQKLSNEEQLVLMAYGHAEKQT